MLDCPAIKTRAQNRTLQARAILINVHFSRSFHQIWTLLSKQENQWLRSFLPFRKRFEMLIKCCAFLGTLDPFDWYRLGCSRNFLWSCHPPNYQVPADLEDLTSSYWDFSVSCEWITAMCRLWRSSGDV